MTVVQEERGAEPSGQDPARAEARRRLQAKREFVSHAVTFVVVNGLIVGGWAVTGAGYFWPAWVMAIWGVGLVLHGWELFWRRPISEADVDRELGRRRR